MKPNLITLIAALEPDELAFLQGLTNDMSEEKLKTFVMVYNGKRKKTDTVLLGCILGFVAVAGVQRFMVGQIGMGILYLFTGGLCFIGTIVDTINHKRLTFEYNQQMAIESLAMAQAY
jgi:TM2 domain-containing membrane protein YozV